MKFDSESGVIAFDISKALIEYGMFFFVTNFPVVTYFPNYIYGLSAFYERLWEFKRDRHNLFIDFAQSMLELGIHSKLVRITKACIEGHEAALRWIVNTARYLP